jgi:hypothetical protein
MNRGKTPRVLWGAGLVNTLYFGYYLDDANAYSLPKPGFERVRVGDTDDAWATGHDYFLTGNARWIPYATAGSITGWDGATGWDAFLQWAREGNTLRFIPDAATLGTYVDCLLVEPLDGAPPLEEDNTRSVALKLRATTAFTGY